MIRPRARRSFLVAAFATFLLPSSFSPAQAPAQAAEQSSKLSLFDRIFGFKQDLRGGWLFVGSKKDGESGIYFAISKDGYNWLYVNDGSPVVRQSERDELMRDPFIQRAPDGTMNLLWTWSTTSPAIGYSTSTDLLHWSKNRKLSLTAAVPGALTTTSPSSYYDPVKKDWLILWSSRVVAAGQPGKPPEERIYSSTTTNFKQFTPAKLFFDPGYNVTDATLIGSGMPGLSYMLFEDERADPPQKHISAAEGPTMIGPWKAISLPITDAGAEAPAPLPVGNGLLVYYHHSRDPEDYGAAFTKDMQHWDDESLRTRFPAGIRHGSVVHITTDEYNMLHDYYHRFDEGLQK
jgi:hypothetical protein